ncbi:hypothetical protein [Costertonia aggregata]|uniref:PAS domain-containing protein n=1 Tax=Costertonia aggregata TaxID=343403 RepID=A0A7H9APL8_9FLAO|nr:hypothetical protein [Costertonia aggregata]QLG45408.1 hypothetical protein HYG79_08625 [Costertonia aggregata]
MRKKEYVELLKYSSPNSIWIVDHMGHLKLLNCPFLVISKYEIGELKKGDEFSVSKVRLSEDLKVVYIIENNPFYYYHFEITI